MPIVTLFRQAIRHLVRTPLVALAFVCLTGIALGALVAAASSLRAVEELAHRFPSPDTLVHVVRLAEGAPAGHPISRPEYADWQARNTVFSQMAAVRATPPPRLMDVVAANGAVTRLRPLPVSSTYFAVLGISPVDGRVFVDSDAQPGAPPVAVLSRRAANTLFGGSEAAIGQSIRVADAYHSPPSTVVGVVADEARLRLVADYDVYLPIVVDASGTLASTARLAIEYDVIGRLRPGITVQESEARLSGLVRQLADEHPIMPGTGTVVSPLHTREYGDVIVIYRYLVLASLAGLAIVLITLVSLCVSTSAARRMEFAVRRACGATTAQLHAQIAMETTLLAIAAAGAAAIVSAIVASWLRVSLPVELALAAWTEPDGPALATGLAGILFVAGAWWGIAALMVLGPDARAASRLRRERWRWLDWTVGVHAALVLACLVPALAVVSGHRALLNTPLGLEPGPVTTANVLVAPLQLHADAFRLFTTRLVDELRRHPNIERVALASGVPLEEPAFTVRVTSAEDDANARVVLRSVSSSYFSTMGIPMTAGRTLSDDPSSCEVVLSNGFSTFGRMQPHIGSEIGIGARRCRVVGIAPAVREGALRAPAPVVYRAFSSDYLPSSLWILATARPGHAIPPNAIESAVSAAGSHVTVDQAPLTSLVDRATVVSRFYAAVLSVASAAALGLVIASVFTLLSHAVRGRRRELAIRSALGGRWPHMGWTVARRVTVGLALGTASGIVASHAILDVLSHLSTAPAASGSWLWVLAVGLLWLTALLAAAAPVVSAVRTDPAAALRDASI